MTQPVNAKTVGGSRKYTKPGSDRLYDSVTSILGALAKDALPPWAAKLCATYAVENYEDIVAMILSGQKEEAIKLIKSEPIRVRDRASAIGTASHTAIEKYIFLRQGGWPYDLGEISEESAKEFNDSGEKPDNVIIEADILPFLRSYDAFFEEEKPEYLLVEATVYSEEHGYAGTLDGIAKFPKLGITNMADNKTSNNVYASTAMQLAAYRHADFYLGPGGKECELPTCDDGVIIHVRPEKTRAVPTRCDREVLEFFLSLRKVHKWKSFEKTGAVCGKAREYRPQPVTLVA